ncbi:hypothetical protein ANO14919_079420 [Xylariales sp. No.14919]|nr:hypothetical protein ANO14919_079420 [Xylariales sp. No.14919]
MDIGTSNSEKVRRAMVINAIIDANATAAQKGLDSLGSTSSSNSEGDSETGLLEGQASSEPTSPSSTREDNNPVIYDDESANRPSLDFPWTMPESKAKEDWGFQKARWGGNSALDELMDMVGLELAKRKFVQINTLIKTANRQELNIVEKFGAVFVGNPGTGKSRVAKIYANFLCATNTVPNDSLTVITGARLVSDGVRGCSFLLDKLKSTGGVLLVEEAHQIASADGGGGGQIIDYLLSEVENLKGKVVFLFSGYGKQMETFCSYNASFSSLIPTTIHFPDYIDHELHLLLVSEIKLRFKKNVRVEGGYYGPLMRIVARRIGRGRSRHGFGNARDVQNTVSKIHSRQADRLFQSMKAGTHSEGDDFILRQDDLLGPPPSSVFNSKAWEELKGMIGLKSVKGSIKAIIHRLQLNYERELAEMPLFECSLNKLFLGNPGTGKTTVAKLYGQILADIGLLSNGDIFIRTPSDLIGDALGQSERNTKAILDSTKGKVLIIDEAYMLGSKDKSALTTDPFRAAVIDTIVGEIQSTAVEDRCVLLVGYRDRMESMLNEVNPALARRFPIASAFFFEDYSQDDLKEIINVKLGNQGLRASDEAKVTALEVLSRARNRPSFGNAGEVDIILDQAKLRQHQRLLEGSDTGTETDLLLPNDFDPDFERGSRSLLDIGLLFDDFVGNETVVQQLRDYELVVRNMKVLSKRLLDGTTKTTLRDPREMIPFTFLFCGPPGTGKTTTANRMGEVFYDMGFLATKDVIECSATDLIGEYVGHTGPKTKRVFDTSLGRVLFIDEAYKLAEGPYGKEAMVEMVNNLAKEKYRNKLVVILAGYEQDINKLMSINTGLNSRFPVVIRFSALSERQCTDLLFKSLRKYGLNTSALEESEHLKSSLEKSFKKLSVLPTWGNARDVQSVAKAIFLKLLRASSDANLSLTISEDLVIREINSVVQDRQKREVVLPKSGNRKTDSEPTPLHDLQRSRMVPPHMTKMKTNMNTTKATNTDARQEKLQDMGPASRVAYEKPSVTTEGKSDTGLSKEVEQGHGLPNEIKNQLQHDKKSAIEGTSENGLSTEVERDPDVADEIWNQLELDKKAAKKRQTAYKVSRNIRAYTTRDIANARATISTAPVGSVVRLRAEERLRIAQEKYEKQREKEEEEKEEEEIQDLLKEKCPLGFDWIKQESGYRCAGGSHSATFEQIKNGQVSC